MKTVLITGGTRGIGRACVEKFSHEGWTVIFIYKNSRSLAEALKKEFSAIPICCDVSKPEDVKNAFSIINQQFSHLDVLVNNAGISYSGLLQEMTDKEWSDTISVNLNSIFYTCRESIPRMLNRGGSIINISSMWGITGASCEVAYSATKAGIIGFTKALAKELAPSNICVNAVAPGVINTDMMKDYSENDIAALCEQTPLHRMGNCDDVANAVYYLASDAASFITGEVLNINGGFLI